MLVCCFISWSFTSRIMKCYISGIICKLLYFENQIATFVGTWEKLLLFEMQIATFVGISKQSPLFTESAAFPGKSTNFLVLV